MTDVRNPKNVQISDICLKSGQFKTGPFWVTEIWISMVVGHLHLETVFGLDFRLFRF